MKMSPVVHFEMPYRQPKRVAELFTSPSPCTAAAIILLLFFKATCLSQETMSENLEASYVSTLLSMRSAAFCFCLPILIPAYADLGSCTEERMYLY